MSFKKFDIYCQFIILRFCDSVCNLPAGAYILTIKTKSRSTGPRLY